MEENRTSNTNTAVPESVGNKKKMGCLPKVLIFIGGFIALFFIIVFISVIVDESNGTQKSDTQTSVTVESPEEISQYIGQSLQFMEQALNVTTKDMSAYQNFENVHRVNQNDDLSFDCTVDGQNNIIKITLYDSGKKGYKLCGLSSSTTPEDADSILQGLGYLSVRDNIWMSADQKDEIKYDEKKWIYEKDSPTLADEILRSNAEANFAYQYNDSVGAVYIGNGQIVEYFHDSYAKMFYEYEHHTDYQKQLLNDKFDGRFIKILGQVTAVSNKGMITVLCQDDEASKAAGVIWPMQGIAEVTLVREQENELISLKKDDNVLIYGQVDFSTYGKILNTFEVNNGILVAVGQRQIKVPFITSVSDGIYTYPSEYAKTQKKASENAANNLKVTSSEAAIAAVKAYGEKEGWSDPYDMYEAQEDGDYYLVFAGHSYLGSDWIECTYSVDKNNKNNVSLCQ